MRRLTPRCADMLPPGPPPETPISEDAAAVVLPYLLSHRSRLAAIQEDRASSQPSRSSFGSASQLQAAGSQSLERSNSQQQSTPSRQSSERLDASGVPGGQSSEQAGRQQPSRASRQLERLDSQQQSGPSRLQLEQLLRLVDTAIMKVRAMAPPALSGVEDTEAWDWKLNQPE